MCNCCNSRFSYSHSYLRCFFYAEKSLLMIAELPLPDTIFGQVFQMTNYFFGAIFLSIVLGQVDCCLWSFWSWSASCFCSMFWLKFSPLLQSVRLSWLCWNGLFHVCCLNVVISIWSVWGIDVLTALFLYYLSQVLTLLLFCRADPDQHRWSSWAVHSVWNHISVDKLFHWCLCLLESDWTGIWCDDENTMSSSPWSSYHIIPYHFYRKKMLSLGKQCTHFDQMIQS